MARAPARRHPLDMTALAAPVLTPAPTIDWPALRRLTGAAVVGGLGVVLFSLAIGARVVGSHEHVQQVASGAADGLLGAIPALVAIGVLHLAVAVGLARGGIVVRLAAVAMTGLAAIVAITAAVMTISGIDPFGWDAGGHPTASGAGLLAIAAVLYGAAAALVGIGRDEEPAEG